MKKIILTCILLFGFSNYSFANCCCEAQIQIKVELVDKYLKSKNEANEKALDELINNMKNLNENILPNRTTEIKNTFLKQEINKFKMNHAKNLYHANSLPNGLLYYQLVKNQHSKDLVIDSINNQTDLIILNSKVNLESLKNSIFNTQKEVEQTVDKNTSELINK